MKSYEDRFAGLTLTQHTIIEKTDDKPGEAVVRLADKHRVDLIVLGSRGLNALKRTFLGSVSGYIIHHSNIPVTVVPPPKV